MFAWVSRVVVTVWCRAGRRGEEDARGRHSQGGPGRTGCLDEPVSSLGFVPLCDGRLGWGLWLLFALQCGHNAIRGGVFSK